MARGTPGPFDGGRPCKTLTLKHEPLIWESMLGTVNARDHIAKKSQYFDYDYDAARKFAKVEEFTDLRIARHKHVYAWCENNHPGPVNGPGLKVALWGIPKPLSPALYTELAEAVQLYIKARDSYDSDDYPGGQKLVDLSVAYDRMKAASLEIRGG